MICGKVILLKPYPQMAVQYGVTYVDALSCKQSYLSVFRHTEVYFWQRRREKSLGENMPSRFFSGCSIVLTKMKSESFTFATLYTYSML